MRAMTVLASAVLAGGLAPAAAADAETDRAVQIAADLLVAAQEEYLPDPPVGTLEDDGLEAWRGRERARLDALVGSTPATRRREWPYEGVYRVGPDGRIPSGYRVGGTAIVCAALAGTPGFEMFEERRDAVARGLAFVLEQLEEDPRLAAAPRAGYDVRGWGHACALDLLLRLRREDRVGPLGPRVEAMIKDLIGRVAANETRAGGWNYAGNDVSPFMTGLTLLALYAARADGFAVDEGLVARALDALEAARTSVGSFAYAGRARGDVAMPGSAARSAIAELALLKAGRSDVERLRAAVEGFFDGWDALLARKSRQGTHEGAYGIAPYYFLFGHVHAARAVETLPAADRPARRARLRELLWRTRERDGSWNDRVFPRTRSVGTAMAALALLAPRLEPVPEWPVAPLPVAPLKDDDDGAEGG